MKPFPGFPSKSKQIPIPSPFFTLLLPTIDDLAELKITLYLLWLLSQKRGYPRFVSLGELLRDELIMEVFGDKERLCRALDGVVARGVFLSLTLEKDGSKYHVYFLNSPEDREAMEKVVEGKVIIDKLSPEKEVTAAEKKDIFSLYEENIGLLTPMIAEELKQAERLYPYSWIKEAIREAVLRNKRSWKYIQRILQRWTSEGRTCPDADWVKRRYLGGKYGKVVRY